MDTPMIPTPAPCSEADRDLLIDCIGTQTGDWSTHAHPETCWFAFTGVVAHGTDELHIQIRRSSKVAKEPENSLRLDLERGSTFLHHFVPTMADVVSLIDWWVKRIRTPPKMTDAEVDAIKVAVTGLPVSFSVEREIRSFGDNLWHLVVVSPEDNSAAPMLNFRRHHNGRTELSVEWASVSSAFTLPPFRTLDAALGLLPTLIAECDDPEGLRDDV